MAGNTDAARMGNALTIAHQKIGPAAQGPDRRDCRRSLAKAEQARDVRKLRRKRGFGLLQRCERREIEQHRRGMRRATAPAIGDIDAGYGCWWREPIGADNLTAQPLLQGNGFAGRAWPGGLRAIAFAGQGCSRRKISGVSIQLMNQAPVTARRTRHTAVPGTKSATTGCSLPTTRRETNRLMNGWWPTMRV